MPAPNEVLKLVENFERNLDAYRSGKYNETQVRRDFIDPLFKALGWDMDNSAGYAEAYRDVIHEDAIKIGNSTKAPDYSFRVGGQRKFFLEAKKPSVNIKDDIEPAFQLRRYAWSAKLPLSIVTDFEEFAIYDCRQKPDKGDKASRSRLFYCTFRDYADKWDEIAAIFSKDAVLKGSFDKYATTSKGKRGTTEVDSAFLEEIEGWRDLLARNIALRNANLSQRELNFAVQQTIDRIIFLRICEDRGIEPYGRLMALQNGVNVYARLRELFRAADDRYNSGLFHFKREKGRAEAPDELTLNLEIDDKPLKEIFKNLYYPDCPYEFSVLGAEILGSVYEQFLGKVIRLTAGNRAVVEDKPEVKKAGGVFYTPAYIVKYIVEHTVGKLLEDKTSKQAAGIAILDPACGSGSFLIGAYQYLLDWYLARYVAEGAEKKSKGKDARLRHSASGEWRLTTAEKKRILLEHLYGVDIDAQAVEVTKLSLLLKMLEGESDETLNSQMKLFHERVLPDLERNIQCGNSLIGPDFYEGQLDLDDEAAQRINVFDWQAAFPHIFPSPSGRGARGEGGFDAVIGNPPYRMLQPNNTEDPILNYLRNNYIAAEFKIELFHLFLQRGISLLEQGGLHGYIVPTTILNNVYAEKLREWLMAHCCIENISVARGQIFATADVHTSVITFRRESDAKKKLKHGIATTSELSEEFVTRPTNFSKILQRRFEDLPGHVWNILLDESNVGLITRLTDKFSPLNKVATINRGLITGDRNKYFSEQKLTKSHVPILTGSDVQRYLSAKPSEFVLFERPDTAGGCWDEKVHLAPHKLVVRQIGVKPTASILTEPIAVTGNIFTVRVSTLESELYLLGIINSRLTDFFWKIMFTDFKSSFPQVTIFSLSQVPIRVIDFANSADHTAHDKLVALVEKMLALHQQLAAAKTPQDSTLLQRQIAATDKRIDQLVYRLYGLTDKEIALVEGTS
ncbi:MAG: restriction endonuclease subunit M [Gallionellaceae bacterium]|nr:MAG: restriction endonuclease subunit M [Gallionellaceae bacterium]